MRYHNDASERVLKAIAAGDKILDSLLILHEMAYLDRAEYCGEAVRWLRAKALLQKRINWHREAEFTDRAIKRLLSDPAFQPDPRCEQEGCLACRPARGRVCSSCDGDGQLRGGPDNEAYADCPSCGGAGGTPT